MKEFKLILILSLWLGIVLHSHSQSGYILKAVDTKHKVVNKSTTISVNITNNKTINKIILFDYMVNDNLLFSNVLQKPDQGVWNNPNMMLDRKTRLNNLNHRFKWKY